MSRSKSRANSPSRPSKTPPTTANPRKPLAAAATSIPPSDAPRERLLGHVTQLGLRLTAERLDELLSESERQRWSHLELLERVLAVPANDRRERSLARRLRDAKLREPTASFDEFDWEFNPELDRAQLEALATGDFVRRKDNVIFVGQSGLGKSRLIQAIARGCCVAGHRVRYTVSAELLRELGSSMADGTTPRRLREYSRYDLLIVDEFGFDKLEREEFPHAASLLYKLMDNRSRRASTALVTNVDFDTWGTYLDDPPLVMAMLDRLVDSVIVSKFRGRSYRAHRAQLEAAKSASSRSAKSAK